ncbi:NAD(P)H-binding protein [Nonomuraea sp. NPDC049504]|uniref:SDR family oxidoreductase n=1 Tax=Nonomuraea sp. NPDC049504 TaxID=3154729 RepID=UPI003436F584
MTGGSGRLGRVVLEKLVGAGYDVRAASRVPRAAAGDVRWVVADLTTGAGVAEAVSGADVVLHLASAPYKGRYTRRVELDGTAALLRAARAAGVRHLVYVSIVGVDRVPWGYFRTKVRAERLVRDDGVPWTILRATQFHEFVAAGLKGMAGFGFMVVDPGVPMQSVDVRDVAGRLLALVARGPGGTIEEYGGPEVLTMEDAVRRWQRARGLRRPVLRLRLPGASGRAFRAGHLTTEAHPRGTITWDDYLGAHPRP